MSALVSGPEAFGQGRVDQAVPNSQHPVSVSPGWTCLRGSLVREVDPYQGVEALWALAHMTQIGWSAAEADRNQWRSAACWG